MDRKRVLVLLTALLVPLGGLEARLVYLQVLEPEAIAGNIRDRKHSIEAVPAPRGRIVDSDGRPLAYDERSFDLHVVLDEYEKDPAVTERLARLLGMTAAEHNEAIERIYARIRRHMRIRPPEERVRILARERRAPYPYRRHVPFEQAYAVETSPELYPGVIVRETLRRVYPNGPVAGSLVGYVGSVTAREEEFERFVEEKFLTPELRETLGAEGIDELLRRGGFRDEVVGRAGLERAFDDVLRGRPGVLMHERNLRTRESGVSEFQPSVPGEDVAVTLDIELQRAVEAILAGARGAAGQPARAAAVVMDCRDGAVLALGSSVRYDPNDFVPPVRNDVVRAILEDDINQPIIHRAVARHFQVGSIFKAITAVAALESGATTTERTVECRGKFRENLDFFKCWIYAHGGAHGPLTLAEALERSCNVYFYQMGHELNLEPVSRWAREFGFGHRTGIEIPAEAEGVLPTTGNHPRWRESDTYSFAIGQHDFMATPVQVARMMSSIANGGRRIFPHLAARNRREPEPIAVSPATIAEVKRGLKAVVQGAHGTAHKSELSRYDIAGKTSTAQTVRGGDTHAWFAGYYPTDEPRYAVVVLVEYGGSGGHAAAPLAAKIVGLIHEKRLHEKH